MLSGFFALAAGMLAIICVLFARWTGDERVLLALALMSALVLLWAALFLCFFEQRLTRFTDALMCTLDGILAGQAPSAAADEDTLFAKLDHRLIRLYETVQAREKRLDAERAKLQSLVSDISHQTKTPITTLKMLTDTLRTQPMNESERAQFLDCSARQIDKLDFLIQALVKTSRLETGVITLEKRPQPLAETIALAASGVLAAMEQKELRFSVSCPETITLPHDRRWTAEALANLLDNAVKYTPAGGRVRLRVEEWESQVKIDVSDTGCGIPEAAQGAIFQRFWRAPAVHEEEGIGLGLYLAREIITLQGGYIRASSAPGKGATFSVFLPKEDAR